MQKRVEILGLKIVAFVIVISIISCSFLERDYKTLLSGTYYGGDGLIIKLYQDGTCKVENLDLFDKSIIGKWRVNTVIDVTAITVMKFDSYTITCYLYTDGGGKLHSSQIDGKFTKQYLGNNYNLKKKQQE